LTYVPAKGVKSPEEIQAVLDKVQPMVNEGNPQAECVWDTLRWVIGEDDEQDPYQLWVEDEESVH
jgi:hypothetical protein